MGVLRRRGLAASGGELRRRHDQPVQHRKRHSSRCPTTLRRPRSAARPTTGSGHGSSAATTAARSFITRTGGMPQRGTCSRSPSTPPRCTRRRSSRSRRASSCTKSTPRRSCLSRTTSTSVTRPRPRWCPRPGSTCSRARPRSTDGGRALFVGLTGPVGTGSLSLFVDAVDQEGDGELGVDLRTADGWHRSPWTTAPTALRRRGMITLTIDVDPVPVRLFGQERVWLRMRGDGTGAWAPEVLRALPQRRRDQPGPDCPERDPRLQPRRARADRHARRDPGAARHRRAAGPRAGERRGARGARTRGTTAPEQVVVTDPEKFPGSWVLWQRVDGLLGQPADARVYVLDPASGRVTFGDGRDGKIPPAGRDGIRAFALPAGRRRSGQRGRLVGGEADLGRRGRRHRRPAGRRGRRVRRDGRSAGRPGGPRLPAGHRARPAPARGPGPDPRRRRGARRRVGHRRRPRALRPRRPARGSRSPSRSRCATATRRPAPTLARRDAVAALLRAAGWGGLGPDAIVVKAPTYVGVAVAVRLVAPRAVLADVEQSAKTALTDLFHPAEGGPDGTGWPFGRPATVSDVLRALGTVKGLDRVVSVEIIPPASATAARRRSGDRRTHRRHGGRDHGRGAMP